MFGCGFEGCLRTGRFRAVHVERDIFVESEGLEMGVCDF
jgi:hypothetical protein